MYEEATKADAVGPPLELRVGPHRADVAVLFAREDSGYKEAHGVDVRALRDALDHAADRGVMPYLYGEKQASDDVCMLLRDGA